MAPAPASAADHSPERDAASGMARSEQHNYGLHVGVHIPTVQDCDDDDDNDVPLIGTAPKFGMSHGRKSPLSPLFVPREDLETTRSGGCCGVQRGLVRFFNTRGLAGMWHWVRVWAALIGTNFFWLGAWNLWELDCVLTPHTPQCVQHPTNHTAHQGHLPVGAWANYSHSRGFGRVSPPPFVGSDANVFNDRLPSWLGGSNTLAFRGEVTMFIGFLLVIASDSLYTNVGFDCGMFPWMHKNELKSTAVGRVLMMVRIFLGLIGGTMLWSGMYYVILYTPPLSHWTFCNIEGMCGHDMIIHGIVFFAGLVVVFATGTWSGATFLYNPEDTGEPNALQRVLWMYDAEDERNMTWTDHIRYIIRSVLSIYGQNLLWVSSGRALDYSTPTDGDILYRVLFLTSFGLLVLSMTDSIAANSWIAQIEPPPLKEDPWVLVRGSGAGQGSSDTELSAVASSTAASIGDGSRLNDNADDGDENLVFLPPPDDMTMSVVESGKTPLAKRNNTIKFYFVSLISLCGQLTFIYALWLLIDNYWIDSGSGTAIRGAWLMYRSTERNIYMVVIGLVLMVLGGALATNAGLAVIPVYTTTTAAIGQLQSEIAKLEKHVIAEIVNSDELGDAGSRTVRGEMEQTFRTIDSLRSMTRRFRRPANAGDYISRSRSGSEAMQSNQPTPHMHAE